MFAEIKLDFLKRIPVFNVFQSIFVVFVGLEKC